MRPAGLRLFLCARARQHQKGQKNDRRQQQQQRQQAIPPPYRPPRLPQSRRERGGGGRRGAGVRRVHAVDRARRRGAAGKGRSQIRLHQADRHGADRDRQGARLLRRRGPLRQGRGAGELEGAARPRHHRRTRRRPYAGRPAARRHHRHRHQGARHHAVLDGPQRQRHHGVQCDLGADEAVRAERVRRQAGSPDQGRRAQESGRQVQGRRQALQHGHGVSGLDP